MTPLRDLLPGALRVAGAGQIALALAHVPFARVLRWREEAGRLSPLNARVFHVHTFFVTYVLAAIGLLSLVAPERLLAPSPLGAPVAGAITVFWGARLIAQFAAFEPVLAESPLAHPALRYGNLLVWGALVGTYGALFATHLP